MLFPATCRLQGYRQAQMKIKPVQRMHINTAQWCPVPTAGCTALNRART